MKDSTMEMIERTAGGIVVRGDNALLVYQPGTNTWGFPKGHVEKAETRRQTAAREVLEETGIHEVHMQEELGAYVRRSNVSPNTFKHITLFLFTTDVCATNPLSADVSICQWVKLQDISEILSYEEDRLFFMKILPIIKKKVAA